MFDHEEPNLFSINVGNICFTDLLIFINNNHVLVQLKSSEGLGKLLGEFSLPPNVHPNSLASTLSDDGMLKITVGTKNETNTTTPRLITPKAEITSEGHSPSAKTRLPKKSFTNQHQESKSSAINHPHPYHHVQKAIGHHIVCTNKYHRFKEVLENVCHENCLTYRIDEDAPAKWCSVFLDGHCRNCGCHWSTHKKVQKDMAISQIELMEEEVIHAEMEDLIILN